ncbi:hypothetical protein BaRGS_00025228 [Batillaria attramentaria]|uniref:Uncharacterized protein n=1 Tax=Batillaria attramentaria TaxID=370345 RepID=A0ABD0K8X6_9CAEN
MLKVAVEFINELAQQKIAGIQAAPQAGTAFYNFRGHTNTGWNGLMSNVKLEEINYKHEHVSQSYSFTWSGLWKPSVSLTGVD